MANKEKWEELTKNGNIICSNWVRGCFNETNDYKRCLSCREKERIKDKNFRNKKKNESLEFNKNNKYDKMCSECNVVESVEKFNINTNKCSDCYQKTLDFHKNRNPRDKIKVRILDIKKAAKNRNLEFELTDEEVSKMIQLNCNYCGIKDNDGILGIDRIDSNIGYIKKNCVPCCEQCNLMKHIKTKKDFLDICEHIASINKLYNGKINHTLFEIGKNGRYISYLCCARKRNIEFNLSKNEFTYLVLQKCNYCNSKGEGYYGIGAGGIDRVDSTKDYNVNNCVPCCYTCNVMKLNYTKESFLNKCLGIINYINNTKIIEEEIIEFFNKYSKNKYGIKRLNPSFFHSRDFYEFRKWSGNLEDLKNVDIELEFVDNTQQKDIWNYYRWNISSLHTFSPNNFIGRTICVLIKDKKTEKYLGIMSLSSDILNMCDRDQAIGWSQEQKINKKKINFISNLSTCVSIQPFGFNFNGGKLIAMLAFSKEIMDKYEEKFNNKLLAIVTTGLHGKSIQYDRLKELKQVGMTKGNSIFWIPEDITDKCRKYLNNISINTTGYKKLEVINKIISVLGLDKDEILSSNKKSIYIGFTNVDSRKYLCGDTSEIKQNTFKSAKIIFEEWYNRWAIQRYNNLIKTNRIISNNSIKSTERAKRYHNKLKEEIGEENYIMYIKEKNKKTYNKIKEPSEKVSTFLANEPSRFESKDSKSGMLLHHYGNAKMVNEPITSSEKAKRYQEKLKKDLGEEKYKELIKIKNQKTYNNKKDKVIKNLSKNIETEPSEKVSTFSEATFVKKSEIFLANEPNEIIVEENKNRFPQKIKEPSEKAKRYQEKLKQEMGEDKYILYIKEKNQKAYMKRKETNNKDNDSVSIEKLKSELGDEKYKEITKTKSREYYMKNRDKILENYNKTKKTENNKVSDNIVINENIIIKPDLPNNISLYRENNGDISIQYNKVIKDVRYNMKHKIYTNNIQLELDKMINNVNIKFPELLVPRYNVTNPDVWNNNPEIINYIKTIKIDTKPNMPKNFSICNVNDTDYIQFCKKIDDKKYQYKTRINSHDIQSELNNFIDYLNTTYDLKLIKEEYIVKNLCNWITTNNIINHEDTPNKIASRNKAHKYIEKKKLEIGEDQYKKEKRIYTKQLRNKNNLI